MSDKNKMRSNKTVLIGPTSRQITGQSVSFSLVELACPNAGVLRYESRKGADKGAQLIAFLAFAFRYLQRLFVMSPKAVYFTSSRTKQGFIRDFVIVNGAVLLNVPKIVNHLHGADFLHFRNCSGTILRFLIDRTYDRITDSVVLADKMKEQYSRYSSTMRTHVVPNTYDSSIDNLPLSATPHQKVHVLYLSNVMRSKGIFELMEAIGSMAENHYRIHLHIAGSFLPDDGISIQETKSQFHKLYDPSRMTYYGNVRGPQKLELLKLAHVVCLPSFYPTEAQPISLIEGLAAGCYLVATRQGYIESIMSNENGTFVHADSASIAHALDQLRQEPSEIARVGTRNRQRAMERFSFQQFSEGIRAVLM